MLLMTCLHEGHCERGVIKLNLAISKSLELLSSRSCWHSLFQPFSSMIGSLAITTFKKLPISNPNRKLQPIRKSGLELSKSKICTFTFCVYTTAPILKIGKYIAITSPPTRTPSTAMINGSSRLLNPSTRLSTSAS